MIILKFKTLEELYLFCESLKPRQFSEILEVKQDIMLKPLYEDKEFFKQLRNSLYTRAFNAVKYYIQLEKIDTFNRFALAVQEKEFSKRAKNCGPKVEKLLEKFISKY